MNSAQPQSSAAPYPSRALRLLAALLSEGPMTQGQIREKVEGYANPADSEAAVKKRLQRDRKMLAEAGIRIDTENGYRVHAEASFTRALPLSDEERLALLFLEPQIPEDPALKRAFAKLNALIDWPPHLRRHARTYYRFDHPHSVDPVVRLCGAALARRRCLEFTYADGRGQRTRRTVEPCHMAYTKGSWYCLAWCRLRQTWRSFNCHRMEEAKLLDEPVDPAREDSKDEAALFDKLGTPSFLYGHGETLNVDLEIGPDAAFMVHDKGWPVDWEMTPEGGLRGQVPVRDIETFLAVLMPWLGHCRLHGPDEIRQRLSERLQVLEARL